MGSQSRCIIGVDVGGTNTDAVLLNPTVAGAGAVIASHKATTREDVTSSIQEAIRALLQNASVTPTSVRSVMIGTTHFINAIIERNGTRTEPVAVIRLASGHFTESTPAFIDFPPELERVIHGHSAIISGGIQVDGSLLGNVQDTQVREQAAVIRRKGIRNIAIIGVYSPTDESHRQEEHARDLLKKELGDDVNIVCSKEIAGIGFLARENATILNASIYRFASRTITNFKRAMQGLNLNCPLYLTSNAGQLLSADAAMRYPIQVFSSGATNSIRGAAFLSTSTDSSISRYVVDIGGTTTEIGCLLPSGFPRLASTFTTIGGVRVNFAMPHVESVGLGGGSLVCFSEGSCRVGPKSVGQKLDREALCFGGNILTATDIFVAADEAVIGDQKQKLDQEAITATKMEIKNTLEDTIDRMKTSADKCHVIVVGGGSFLCPDDLDGVAKIYRPQYADVANAIGAAIAEVGATVEKIVDSQKGDEALVELRLRARAEALSNGAREDSIRTIDEAVSQLPYIEGKCRVMVKVAGPVDFERFAEAKTENTDIVGDIEDDNLNRAARELEPLDEKSGQSLFMSVDDYRPHIDNNRLWHISETDLLFISIGCYMLGCGGGGSPYSKYLETRQLLRSKGKISIIDLADIPEDGACPPVSGVGSPAVGVERLGGHMVLHALETIEKHLSISYSGMLSVEIGGSNGMEPLLWGSSKYYGLPCVDGDLMGRAFPTFEKITPFIEGEDINSLLPVCLSDGNGTNLIMTTSKDAESVDKILRAAVVTMGSIAGGVSRPLTGKELRRVAIPNTHSLSWRLGRAVMSSRSRGAISTVAEDLIREFGGPQSAGKVFSGKIVRVGESLYKGHSYGNLVIQKLRDHERDVNERDSDYPEKVQIPFKNENLLLEAHYASGEKKILATVPDLIMVLDTLTGEAVGVPEYRYGLKVMVIVATAHPLWTSTKRALDISGPRAFGYDLDHQPYGKFTSVRSVIEEFGPST